MNNKLIKSVLPLVIFVGAIIVAVAIINTQPELKKRHHKKKLHVVDTLVLMPQDWSSTIKTQGLVEARTMTTLASRVTGDVEWVSAELKPGGFFEKGQVLLKIETIDYRLAIKTAEAELAEARFVYQEEKAQSAQAVLNWANLGRTKKPSDLVLRKPQMARARAVVGAAKATLDKAHLELKRTTIIAPYAGRVLEQYVDVGQFVSPGKELVKLFAIDRVEVRLPLSEAQREQLQLPVSYRGDSMANHGDSLPITVTASIANITHRWEAKFSRMEGVVNRDTRQQYLVAEIEDSYQRNSMGRPPLEVGQFVRAEIKGRINTQVFVLPRSAFYGEDTIMLVDDNNQLQRRVVKPFSAQGDYVIVREGIKAGERLSTTYLPFIANKTTVKLSADKDMPSNGTKADIPKGGAEK